MGIDVALTKQTIRTQLPDVSELDHEFILRVTESIYQSRAAGQSPQVAYPNTTNDYFIIRVAKGVSIFTDTDVQRLFNFGGRIRDVQVYANRKQLNVTVWKAGAKAQTFKHVAPGKRKRMQVGLAWESAKVTSRADQVLLEKLIGEIYHVQDLIPEAMCVWIEPILADTGAHSSGRPGDGRQREAVSLPLSQNLATEEASESSVVDNESDRVGYAICCASMPDFSTTFFQHLKELYGNQIYSMYVWVDVPSHVSKTALVVVLVRRADGSGSTVLRTPYLPRGVKRARTRSATAAV